MKYVGLKILLIVNFILLLVDGWSTLRVGEVLQYLEINPLYKFIGLGGIFILNLIILAGNYFLYSHWPNPNLRYLILFSLVAVAMTRIMIIPTNLEIGNSPPTIEEAKAISEDVKVQEAVTRLVVPNFLPFFNGIIAFVMFGLDHKIRGKEENV